MRRRRRTAWRGHGRGAHQAGTPPSDIAVLVRTNGDARRFLRSLDVRGVPWRFSGASGLYARREVRDLLAFLRVVADPDSSVDLYAVATGEPYRLGGEDLTALLETARRRHRSFWEVATELMEQPGLLRLQRANRAALERLVADVRDAIERIARDADVGSAVPPSQAQRAAGHADRVRGERG